MEQENIDNQVNEKKRPTAITVICELGFIEVVFAIRLFYPDISGQIGSWYPFYLGLSAFIGLLCMIGLWQMKKWAVYAYIGFVGLNQIVFLTLGIWNVMALIIPAIVVSVALTHLKKMD